MYSPAQGTAVHHDPMSPLGAGATIDGVVSREKGLVCFRQSEYTHPALAKRVEELTNYVYQTDGAVDTGILQRLKGKPVS